MIAEQRCHIRTSKYYITARALFKRTLALVDRRKGLFRGSFENVFQAIK